MIDHIWVPVRNYEKSKAFYANLLSPLALKPVKDRPTERRVGFDTELKDSHSDFWIVESDKTQPRNQYCVAFKASSKDEVNKFYQKGLEAGGKCNGKPGYRDKYHPGYYAAYIIDIDGYNIEAVYDERFAT